MESDPFSTLFALLTSLPGIGPTLAPLLEKACGGPRVLDLLFHLPDGFTRRTAISALREAQPGTVVTIALDVVAHHAPATRRQPWRVKVMDREGCEADIVFFSRARLDRLPIGTRVAVSGKADRFGEKITFPHPDHIVPITQMDTIPAIEPVWPLTAGLFPGQIRRALKEALGCLPDFPEWIDPHLLAKKSWPCFGAALHALHQPEQIPDQSPHDRLAYDELFAHQLAMAWMKRRERQRPGRSLSGDNTLREEALIRFGKPMTGSQLQALSEIDGDMAAPRRMLRLLQGDVGAGKTLVALMAMLRAVEAGTQAAMMAPTELLAQQHYRTLSKLSPVQVGLLTGSVKGVARRNLLLGIQAGRIKIIVGTHALFQDSVQYRDLGLAVIDEQHRFGVEQRGMLGSKGNRTDVLVMTATPIPRTLLLTQWGEMDVSRLTEKPAGRQPIRTTLHPLSKLDAVIDGIGRALDKGDRVYWVCPLVSESAVSDMAAAEERFAVLRARFGEKVGLAHGQQDSTEREAALAEFAAGRTSLLVATTVVEVGVDVPEASIMVVEHAERFGLAQLHQLRGRVGRGAAASFCLLLHEDGMSETARRRLTLLRDTEDGFLIADEDFRLRGGGDLLGKRQSGLPSWRLADTDRHAALLRIASRDAAYLLDQDPGLTGPRGLAARSLLRLFGRGDALRNLDAG
ncbi:ATP-dependent DNA helicase recG [Granulibacter bethesdensis]|uniref:ATP-dependent DNA helicase recG n=1 Tax=Granulibacter bethesdensis TaxID=364410 RepID=A0AAN0VFL0_9PROT|nr:ATP-dependent DNA helicase RecG [Granulibacter bethesdensis]AHJ62658.1 ATP-dependent DNA helicase recG [Granulibacter bethesdensis]